MILRDNAEHTLVAVFEFCSEIYRLKKDCDTAIKFVQQGKDLLKNSKSIDEFLLRKQEGVAREDLEVLRELKLEAIPEVSSRKCS